MLFAGVSEARVLVHWGCQEFSERVCASAGGLCTFSVLCFRRKAERRLGGWRRGFGELQTRTVRQALVSFGIGCGHGGALVSGMW